MESGQQGGSMPKTYCIPYVGAEVDVLRYQPLSQRAWDVAGKGTFASYITSLHAHAHRAPSVCFPRPSLSAPSPARPRRGACSEPSTELRHEGRHAPKDHLALSHTHVNTLVRRIPKQSE